MNKTQKILIAAVIVLILTNLVMVGLMWKEHRHRPRRGHTPPRNQEMRQRIFERELDLSREQSRDFRNLYRAHRKEMSTLGRKQRQLQKRLHHQIVRDDSTQQIAMDDSVRALQEEMRAEANRFIQEIASICTPEQRQRLLELLDEAMGEDAPPP